MIVSATLQYFIGYKFKPRSHFKRQWENH